MQSGILGIVAVMVALTGTILGGFLANVEDVSVTSTDWTYFTDVAGAFESEQGDIYSSFDPASNLTGWSVFPEYNNRNLTGVAFTESYPNEYYVYTEQSSAQIVELTVTPNKANTASSPSSPIYPGQYTISGMLGDDSWSASGTINRYQGFNNSQKVTEQQTMPDGVVKVPVSAILNVLKSNVTFTGEVILEVFGEWSSKFATGSMQDPNSRVFDGSRSVFEYLAPGNDGMRISYDRNTDLVTFPSGARVLSSSVSLMWVCNGFGTTDNNPVGINAVVQTDAVSTYVNPAEGVTPQVTTLTTSRIERITTGAQSVDIELSGGDYTFQGFTVVHPDGIESTVGSLAHAGSSWTWTYDGATTTVGSGATLSVSIDLGGYTVGSQRVAFDAPISSIEQAGLLVPASDVPAFAGTLAYRYGGASTAPAPIEVPASGIVVMETMLEADIVVEGAETYDTVYWNNSQSNRALTLVLERPSSAITQTIEFRNGDSVVTSVDVSYIDRWNVGTTDFGSWPAIALTIDLGAGALFVQPIDKFVNHTDYDVLGTPIRVSEINSDAGVVTTIAFSGLEDGSFNMTVNGTYILIANGGAYMVNATLDATSAFGDITNDKAIQLSFDSFVRIGSGITINGDTFPVDADTQRIEIEGKMLPLARTMAVYIPSEFSGFYYRGATYESGHAYIIDSRLNVHDLGTADQLIVTLDGMWLTTANMSLGETAIETSTQWSGSAWSMDLNASVVLFLGILVIAAIIGRWRYDASYLDLAIIGGAALFAFVLLG